jgi:hypothetical protein
MNVKFLPNTTDQEMYLLERMKSYDLKPDIDFINFLIKRRITRNKYKDADV